MNVYRARNRCPAVAGRPSKAKPSVCVCGGGAFQPILEKGERGTRCLCENGFGGRGPSYLRHA